MSAKQNKKVPAAGKPKDFSGATKKLLAYMKPFMGLVVLMLIFTILGALFAIIAPKVLGEVTTTIFNGVMSKQQGGDGIDFSAIRRIVNILILIYVGSALFNYLMGLIAAVVSQRMTFNLRQDISEKLHALPLNYYDTKTHGEILSRITNDVDTISTSLQQSLVQILASVATVVGIIIIMFTISLPMTIAVLLTLPITLLLIINIIPRSQKQFKEQQITLGNLNGHVEEMYSGHNVMKLYSGEKESIKSFGEINTRLYDSAWKSQFLSGLLMPITTFVGNLGYVAVSVLGAYLVINGRLSIGDIQAFIQYVRQFNQPITQIANVSNLLQSTVAAAERVFEFLEEENMPEDTKNPQKPQNVTGAVAFDDIKFGYLPDKIIIKGFSANIRPGMKVAIVGPTGAGKTTLINLLERFYDVNSGRILIDGVDIMDMKRHDLRSIFGMVLQDTWLFGGTIRENLKYGRPDATDEQMIEAAKAAHAHHFITTLPGGYDMVLGEDATNISQGQKQLLTIARALLSDPTILILDEATSSVDTRTEMLIQKAMETLTEGRTSFVIAHRLSTIRNADLIFVLKDGNIIEQGSHDELIEKKGFYAGLYNSQFEKVS